MFSGRGPGEGLRQDRAVTVDRAEGRERSMDFILWIIAVILVIAGIVTLIRGGILWGIVLIIVGLLVGPGGVSIFH
jgi:hypothetical protein